MIAAGRPDTVYVPESTITTQCGVKVVSTNVYDNHTGALLREEIVMMTPRRTGKNMFVSGTKTGRFKS